MTVSGQPSVEWETLGQAIRARRLARGLTLVDLAAKVGLSQPFLSQVENGRARPSMMSLYRVAGALDTTPQAFFGGPVEGTGAPALVRADAARAVEVAGETAASVCRLLLAGDAPFHVLEFQGLPADFLEYWEHDGFEAAFVIEGDIELDVGGTVTELHPGDFLSYPAHLPHRLRAPGGRPARVLLMETRVEAAPDRRLANHVPVGGRKRTTRTVKAAAKGKGKAVPKVARRSRA
jgi:transcriptional regulator with XRE-family HTH domain